MLNTRQRPTVNVDLNDSESFLFFWKYLAAIGDSNVNAVDTFIVSKGKLIRWYATDVDTRCVKRHPIDLSSLTNKEFVLLVKKILQSKKYLKVYKDKFRKSKIACVWYLDTLSTLKAVYVDEPTLLGVMNDGLGEVVCIQVLFGGKPFKNSGVFEHKYSSRADGKKTSHETYEIGLDMHADHHDHGGAYDVHIFKECERIVLAGTNLNKTFEKFAARIVEYIETTARCKVTNITLQIVCDISWTPYVVGAKSIMLASAPYEYNNTLREMLIFEDGVQPQLSSAINGTIARLEKQHLRSMLHMSASYKNLGTLGEESRIDGESKFFTSSISRSLRGSDNPDGDIAVNAASTSPSMMPKIPRYKLDTTVSATRASAYQSSIRPKVVEIERPATADSYLKADHRLSTLTLHGHEKGKRSSGITKKLHAHALKDKCWGQFCTFSPASDDIAPEYTSISYKSLVLSRAEEKYIGTEEFQSIVESFMPEGTAFTDHWSNQLAKKILEAVGNKSRMVIKQVALSSIPGFTQSLREYYDMFSRRAIYVDDYHRNHSTRLYHSSVVCNICAKMYNSLDYLRDLVVFNNKVHKERKLRPLSCRRPNTREVALDRSTKRSNSPSRGMTLPAMPATSTAVQVSPIRRSTGYPSKQVTGDDEEEEEDEEEPVYAKPVVTRRPTGLPSKHVVIDEADGIDIDEEVSDEEGANHAKPVATRRPTGYRQYVPDDDVDGGEARLAMDGGEDVGYLAENSLEMSLLTSSIDNDGNVDYNGTLANAHDGVDAAYDSQEQVFESNVAEPAFLEENARDEYKAYLESKRKSRKAHQDKLSKPKYTTKRNIRLTTSDTLPQWLNMMRMKEKEVDKIIMEKSGSQEVTNESLYASMNSLLLQSNINDFSKIYGDSIRHANSKKKRSATDAVSNQHDSKYKVQ